MRLNKLYLISMLAILISLPLTLQARYFARWFTTLGSFTADLRDEIVPITANNFINLTNSGFYDGLHFHRVIEDFVIQDGDPLGTGYGGSGHNIIDEFSPLLHHDAAGVLAMAHSSLPNSASSQYYITLSPQPQLDGDYAIFGKVFEGLDVVLAIGQVPVDANDHPITPVYIDSLRILDLVIFNVSPPQDSLVTFDGANPTIFSVEAFNPDMSVQIAWYIDDILQPQFTDIFMTPVFTTTGLHTVKCVASDPQLTWPTVWQVNVVAVSNTDPLQIRQEISSATVYPNPFYGSARLDFNLAKSGPLSISIYDCKGRLIESAALQGKSGLNSWNWNALDKSEDKLPAGIYLLKIQTASDFAVQKAVLLR